MQAILKLSSLEFIDTSKFQQTVFDFRETKAFLTQITDAGLEFSKFADAGYESSIFFELLGPILLIVLLFATVQLIKLLTKWLLNKCQIGNNCFSRRIRAKTSYAVIISRFLLEGSVEIGLSAIISLHMLEKESFEGAWEVISIIFAGLTLCGAIVTPFIFAKLINRYLKEAEIAEDPHESPLFNLFEPYRLDRQALWYLNVFLVRRYILIMTLTVI